MHCCVMLGSWMLIGDDVDVFMIACLDDAEVSTSGLKIGRSPVQISPKTNFSIMIKLPVNSTGK